MKKGKESHPHSTTTKWQETKVHARYECRADETIVYKKKFVTTIRKSKQVGSILHTKSNAKRPKKKEKKKKRAK